MLTTVTNLTTDILNDFDTLTAGTVATVGPAAMTATGGARLRPLPYPFGHVVLAASGSKELPMNQRDWRTLPLQGVTFEPGVEWSQLVQAGTVSMAFAAQTTTVDPENLGDAADTL